MKTTNRILAVSFFGLIIVFILGLVIGGMYVKQLSDCVYAYEFINKSLNCENDYAVKKSNLAVLRQKLNLYIKSSKDSGKTESISIYFRDLHNGPTMEIG